TLIRSSFGICPEIGCLLSCCIIKNILSNITSLYIYLPPKFSGKHSEKITSITMNTYLNRVYKRNKMTWSVSMTIFLKLIIIGLISGMILAASGKIIRLTTGNKAEILLYNMDYMPVLKKWSDKWITGIIFHYMTCIVSAVVLFYMLVPFGWETNIWPYVLVYTA